MWTYLCGEGASGWTEQISPSSRPSCPPPSAADGPARHHGAGGGCWTGGHRCQAAGPTPSSRTTAAAETRTAWRFPPRNPRRRRTWIRGPSWSDQMSVSVWASSTCKALQMRQRWMQEGHLKKSYPPVHQHNAACVFKWKWVRERRKRKNGNCYTHTHTWRCGSLLTSCVAVDTMAAFLIRKPLLTLLPSEHQSRKRSTFLPTEATRIQHGSSLNVINPPPQSSFSFLSVPSLSSARLAALNRC